MTPEIKRSMAFMNCPWKSTAGCNYICETCLHSDSDGFRTLLDDINRLGRQIETKEGEAWEKESKKMTALTILAIALSVGAIALCAHIDFLHVKEDEVTLNLNKQHDEIMRHMINYMGTLEQRIKKLEEEVKKGENDG